MEFENNVYMVKGAKNSAIYNLNKGMLYSLNDEATSAVHKAVDLGTILSDEEASFIESLKADHILTEDPIPKHDISEIMEIPKIDFAWIEITTGCNLRCVHCYDVSSPMTTVIMSYSDFCRIIDELVANDIRKIQMIGGEPFILGKRLYQYLDYCAGKFEYIEIFTNGTLVTDEGIAYLKRNRIRLALSVYSYFEDEHNKVTQDNDSFRKTNVTIQKLRDAGIQYRVKNVLMNDLDQGTCNTDLYKLDPRRDIVRMVGRANISLLNEELLKKKLITPKRFARKLDRDLVIRIVSGHNCFSRRLYFAVDSQVYPCVMERRISHGNIQEKSY